MPAALAALYSRYFYKLQSVRTTAYKHVNAYTQALVQRYGVCNSATFV